MKNYTPDELKAAFAKRAYNWMDFHLVGIRAANYVKNTFCDMFILVANGRLYYWPGTTRPGTYYLLHLLNPKGAAVLKPGQYCGCWSLGYHKNNTGHPAWIQTGPVTVYRDNNLNDSADTTGVEDTGYFGIDIHRATPFTITRLVDKYSAGCQVFANYSDHQIFMELSKASGLKSFTYTLLNEF
jgi:hypothetical protein